MRQAVVLGVFALLCASLATGPALLAVEAPAKAGPATAAASDPEALAFRKVCGGCHSVSMFDSEPRGRAEWMETLKVMFERGAGGTDEEIDDVVRYLDANLTKLNVNAADADEIGSVLDVPDVVSAAIVARRKELGRFKSLAEIAAVPGVDARRLEHRRPRISF